MWWKCGRSVVGSVTCGESVVCGESRGPLLKKRKGNALVASAVARAYKGGLGALPPVGSRGKATGQGVRGAKPPEAEAIFMNFVSNFAFSAD